MNKLNQYLRRLSREKLNTSIMIISLAIGLACINLIALFIQRELKTDDFHTNADQIYALQCDDPFNVGEKMYHCRSGAPEYMKTNISQIEEFCKIDKSPVQKIIVNNESYFDDLSIIATSAIFFEFFTYELLTNNPKAALETEKSLVISKELAKKYFGESPAVGQVINLISPKKEDEMVISGVFQKPDENTQIHFDMVRLIGDESSRGYVRLNKKANPQKTENIFATHKEKIPSINTGTPGQYYLKPLKEAYFDDSRRSRFENSRDKNDLWIALAIGITILLVASFNYLGLVNNKLHLKNSEYAVRLVNGGSKRHLIQNFMGEICCIIGVSFLFSVILMIVLAPYLNNLLGTHINIQFILQKEQLPILLLAGIFLLIATYLFTLLRIRRKVDALAIKTVHANNYNRVQFPVFTVFQLAASVILIIGSIIIIKQINYITNKPIGLDKEVIEVKIPPSRADITPIFQEKLAQSPGITNISVTNASPVLEYYMVLLFYQENGVEKQYTPAFFRGDENFISTMGIEIIQGEGFTGNPQVDENRCLINESFTKLFPTRNLLGTGVPGMEDRIITGVVKDFHYLDLKSVVEPAIINFSNNGNHLLVKAVQNQLPQVRQAISNIWYELIPDYPLKVQTIGERYAWMHRENKNYVKLVASCSAISIFLSMIGLFAIAFQNSKKRIKEIGVRKVNGARTWEVLNTLNKDFVKWVIIACIMAMPIAWYVMNQWLQNFAYKTKMDWWVFALASIVTLLIALLTVSWQSWRTANRNPVEALRYE